MYVKCIPSLFYHSWTPDIEALTLRILCEQLICLGVHFSKVWVTKAKYYNQTQKNKTLILAYKPVHFALLTDSVITLSAKLLNSWPWMQTQQLSVGVITGFFEKQTSLPGSNKLICSPFSSNFWVCWLTLLAYTFKWKFFDRNFWEHCVLCFLGFTFGVLSIHTQLSMPHPPPKKKNKKNKKKETWNIKFFLFPV